MMNHLPAPNSADSSRWFGRERDIHHGGPSRGGLPVQGTSGSFRGKVLRLENRYYHTVYVDRVRMYVPGRSPEPERKPRIRRSRLRIRADYAPIRNVIAIARQYEAYLKEPGIYTYRQAAEHFSTSKVTVGYHLALLTRLPADFVEWLEACTEDLPMTFFSLRRLRPVTMMSEPERKGALLELARTLVREMEGQPSEVVPELLWMLDEELHQMPRRLLRSIMLD